MLSPSQQDQLHSLCTLQRRETPQSRSHPNDQPDLQRQLECGNRDIHQQDHLPTQQSATAPRHSSWQEEESRRYTKSRLQPTRCVSRQGAGSWRPDTRTARRSMGRFGRMLTRCRHTLGVADCRIRRPDSHSLVSGWALPSLSCSPRQPHICSSTEIIERATTSSGGCERSLSFSRTPLAIGVLQLRQVTGVEENHSPISCCACVRSAWRIFCPSSST